MLPPLAAFARARSRQLGLPLSTYFGVLLWNYSQAPERMKPEPAAGAFAREHVPSSVNLSRWGVTPAIMRKSGLNRNALVEALVAEDRAHPGNGLHIRARS